MKNLLSLFTQHKEIKMTPEEKKATWEAILAHTFTFSIEMPVKETNTSKSLSPVSSSCS